MKTYVVIDLEMCRVPRDYRRCSYMHSSETIQIGAALLNEEFEIVDLFDTYVKPEYGFIDEYIKTLTGIKEKDIKSAPNIEEALEKLVEWMPEDSIIVSWSMTDKKQIEHETTAKRIKNERIQSCYNGWIDCQKEFAEKLHNHRSYRLSEALIAADIDFVGEAHDGKSDAINTAKLFAKIHRDEEFKMNSWYEIATEEPDHLSFSLGDIFGNLQLQIA